MQITVTLGTVHTHNIFRERNKLRYKKVGIPKGMPTFAV